jgi:hypothetical protein
MSEHPSVPGKASGAQSAAKPRPLKSDPRIKLADDGRIIHFPVRLRSVIERLNRKLKQKSQSLHKERGQQTEFGPYFIVTHQTPLISSVTTKGIDEKGLEQMARQQGALRSWEEMTP